jgi:tryptophan halogenase
MKLNKIAVVGGGTAGLISALILKKRFPNKTIDVIHSSKLGIIGVGEGSTEHWRQFMEFLGIDQFEMLRRTDGSLKMGIMFQDWADKPYMHSLQSTFDGKAGQHPIVYSNLIARGVDPLELVSQSSVNSLIGQDYLTDSKKFYANQFHFNTHKLNEYLLELCVSSGIDIIDDVVNDVTLDDNGNVKSVTGEKEYKYDFYIDSTGFKRIIIGKLGAKWISHAKYLKMKSAIVFPLPEEPSIPMWTLAKAMDYGWLFRIPVYDRFGNGYIFDSDYITADQAKDEVERYFGKKIEVAKTITFDPGALDKVWIKNCVAIGLSASFVEPLEASSIGTSIQQVFLLMHRLENYDDAVIESYNKSCNDILINIRDFIVTHYLTNKTNTQFWKDVSSIELPKTLKKKLDLWKHKLPVSEDFSSESQYILFNANNYLMVLYGLGLVDKDSVKLEYESYPEELRNYIESILHQRQSYEMNSKMMTHKKFLKKLRESGE